MVEDHWSNNSANANKSATQSKGILTIGTDFTIHGLEISLGLDGVNISHNSISLRQDLCRYWLQIALVHLVDAAASNRDLIDSDASGVEERLGPALEREFLTSMQAMVAAAIALDALYAAVKGRVNIPSQQQKAWKENKKTARWKQMAEVIRISFDVSGNGFDTIRTHLDQVMKFRGWAVHPPAEQTAPVLHPDINRGVEWRFVAFRYSNAVTTVRIALSLANQLVMKPKIKFPALVDYCESMKKALEPLAAAWSEAYPTMPI